ncbi:MAG: ferredoxin:protochlorophyllide reductase (ATP-dependent) subunit B [Parvularculaceae bacterium]
MRLAVWTYEGPPHVGAMRVVAGLKDVHYVLHAPQGDTYADLLFTMIERRPSRPPVTYTPFEARDLGGDTANGFKTAVKDAFERFKPAAMVVGASCTAELLQDDPAGLAKALDAPAPVIPVELPAYQRKEGWGAGETFYRLARGLAHRDVAKTSAATGRPTCNVLGPTALGFRHRDDVKEISRLLADMGVDVAVTAPLGASAADLERLGAADFNVVLYPETADAAARWLEKTFGQPYTKTIPIGVGSTHEFIAEVASLAGLDAGAAGARFEDASNLPWWSRSIDSNYLTGKRVFVFGDATHAIGVARVAAEELGFEVVGLGCYNREFARDLRAAAENHGVDPLITDDYLEVEAAIADAEPELVLGGQMERHIAKKLGIACAVISAPAHVQDYPARYAPLMGFEGANVLFDTLVHPLVMGLEEHLLGMFREDFEFNDAAGPSHLGSSHLGPSRDAADAPRTETAASSDDANAVWTAEAEAELKKIPFFVRGKARKNAERFACDRGLAAIDVDVLYDAKAHYGR